MDELRTLRAEFLDCLDIIAEAGGTLSGNTQVSLQPAAQPQPRPSQTAPSDRH
jgi:hypothetical protein